MLKGYSLPPLFVTSKRGQTHMTSNMPEGEMSGEGPNCMTSDVKGWGSKPNDQPCAREGKATLVARSFFSQLCPLLGTRAVCPGDLLYLDHCLCSAYVCLTAYHRTTDNL